VVKKKGGGEVIKKAECPPSGYSRRPDAHHLDVCLSVPVDPLPNNRPPEGKERRRAGFVSGTDAVVG